jgi:plasmid stability protein
MASLIVRQLDDAVASRLKLQALLRGVSVEEEVRRILAAGTALSRSEIAATARAIRARQPLHRSRAAQLVRQDRSR